MADNAWLDDLPSLVGAAARGDVAEVERLLAAGVPASQADEDGWTALHAAATRDHVTIVRVLLNEGADVHSRTSDGFTPLLNAASASRAVIEALLNAGSDPMVQDRRMGWRPLDRFAEYGNEAGVELVLKAGAVVDAEDFHGGTALADAAEAGCGACVELLLAVGADATRLWDGETAADLAAKHGHDDLAARLQSVAS